MEQLVFDSGLERYEIVDVNGKVLGTVEFNPRDLNFYARAKSIYAEIVQLIRDAQMLAQKVPEGVAEEDYPDITEQILTVDRKIKEKLDEMAGCNISAVAFGNANCMSLGRNGQHLCRNLLEMLAGHIEKKFEEQKAVTEKLLAEYTEDYDAEAGSTAGAVAN